jgi:hypothetical protein
MLPHSCHHLYTFLLMAMLASVPVQAQMPVPLLDDAITANPAAWKRAAPVMKDALECRRVIKPTDPALRSLLPPNKIGQWEVVPPQGFAVFGLPVQSITIYIDPDGELGASYTATVAAPLHLAAGRSNAKGLVGLLNVEPGDRPSLSRFICTVP